MFYVSELFVTDKKCISFGIYRIFKIFLQKNVESEFQNGNFGNRPKKVVAQKGRNVKNSQIFEKKNFSNRRQA